MSEVTIELIDALLIPTTFSSPNSNAEEVYESIPIPSRVQSLLRILQSLLLQETSADADDNSASIQTSNLIPRCMLIAVLLRRNVSSFGSYSVKNVKLKSEWQIVRLLGEMVSPLLNIFVNCCGTGDSNNSGAGSSVGNGGGTFQSSFSKSGIQRQIGFIISEVCASLSVMEDSISIDVMNIVLDQISQGVSNANKACLQLLSSLAQQSPLSLMKSNGKESVQLLQNAIKILQKSTRIIISTKTSSSSSSSLQSQLQVILQHYQIILQAMNHLAIASDIQYPQSLSDNPKERMVQLIQAMTNANTTSMVSNSDPKKLSIKPHSNAANIGKLCLPHVLDDIITIVNATTTSPSCHPNTNTQETIQEIMQSISQCASTCPTVLAADYNLLSKICKSLICIGENKGLEAMVRLSSCEALVTLCMVPDIRNVMAEQTSLKNLCLVGKENGSVGISDGCVGGMIGICTELLIYGVDEDIHDWATEDIVVQDEMLWDNDDVSNFAEMIIYSFLHNGGGGSQSLPVVLSVVESLLQSTSWQELRAGFIIIDACLTASPHSFSPHMPVAVEAALNFINHDCVRVQYQAIELLGSLCQHDTMTETESQTICMRKEYGRRILQSFAQSLTSKCSKIISHACLGIVSFCRGGNGKENTGISVDKAFLLPYLGDLLNAIATGPLSKDVMSHVAVYIRAFASVACLADVAGEDFSPYFDMMIKGLMDCITFGLYIDSGGMIKASGQNSHEYNSLRGAAVEAATIVGQSIGDEDNKFHSEAEKIMNIVVPLLNQQSGFIPQDHLLSAAARISSIIGPAYNPYIPSVLPFLLKIAKEETDVCIAEGNPESSGDVDYEEEDGFQSVTVTLPGMGAKKLTLNTSQIQEKILSARAVYEHAHAMGKDFGPYFNDCLDAFEPLLQFKYSSEVRATASQALHPIFESAFEFIETSFSTSYADLLATAYPRVLLVLSTQLSLEENDDIETLIAISDALSNICYSAFSHKQQGGSYFARLNNVQAAQFTTALLNVIGACLERRSHIIALLTRNTDEDQQAELQDILAIESEFLTNVVDSIGYNLKCLKEEYLPIFERCIEPAFGPLLTSSGTHDLRARFAALCLFCDCVEHCGSVAAARYAAQLSQGCEEGLDDSTNCGDIELKEVSVYGFAQIARFAPKSISMQRTIGNIALRLLSIAKEAETKEKDDIEDLRLVENAASALSTLTLFQSSPFQPSNLGIHKSYILNAFMSNLPITMDQDEAKYCHKGFCELVEEGHIGDLKKNMKNLVEIIGQIAAAVGDEEDIATKDTCIRLVKILSTLQQTHPKDFEAAYSSLSQESQNGINVMCGSL